MPAIALPGGEPMDGALAAEPGSAPAEPEPATVDVPLPRPRRGRKRYNVMATMGPGLRPPDRRLGKAATRVLKCIYYAIQRAEKRHGAYTIECSIWDA